MHRPLTFLWIFIFFFLTSLNAQLHEPFNKGLDSQTHLIFTPPPGWKNADCASLPKQVELMVVGKGAGDFPPSISLATEVYSGTLKQYLKRVKELNASKGFEWKDLGNIKTQAGNVSLSQTDSQSQWGNIRMMHVMLKKDDTIFILTAAALKEEFPKFYKEIFTSLRSIHFISSTSEN